MEGASNSKMVPKFSGLERSSTNTRTSPMPMPGGETHCSFVFDSHTTDWQGLPPIVTDGLLLVAPKLFPTIVTIVPPAALPCPGSMARTDGASYLNTDAPFIALVSPLTETVTGLFDPTPSGVSHNTDVDDTHTTCGHGDPPTTILGWTLPLPVPKFMPPIVMMVPPAVGPFSGLMSLINGTCDLLTATKLNKDARCSNVLLAFPKFMSRFLTILTKGH
mmetsp:Transcript_17350/g.34619  ORF Transcript_17350/g.34619 Transcript_17350/m.34619 type:complete len:219 (-) Transcript_17350:37-693(-)